MEGSGTLGFGVYSVRMVRQAAWPQELMFQVVGGSRQLTSLGGSLVTAPGALADVARFISSISSV